MCTIKDSKGHTIAKIPRANGLYCTIMSKSGSKWEHANIVSEKITISQAHWKLSHMAHAAIKHAVAQGYITGIEIDPSSKPKFCEPCAKAKSAWQPFPKESQTRAEKYGEQVHWDL